MGILGMAEGSWVDVILGAFGLFLMGLALYVKLKTKVDKNDFIADAKLEIEAEIKPIIERMTKYEADFRDFKRDEIAPMKETLNELVTTTTVIQSQMQTMIEGQDKIEKLIGKLWDEIKTKKDK